MIQVQGHIFQIADVEVGVAPAARLNNIWSSALEPNNRYPLWYKLISEPGHPSAAVAGYWHTGIIETLLEISDFIGILKGEQDEGHTSRPSQHRPAIGHRTWGSPLRSVLNLG